ncbi:MAG TPA: protein kinase, partial [Gemmatimonadaceae bacterium]|nr:protein kinase [Gemmatimonadaceae bacterium]
MTSLETLKEALADRYEIDREIGSGGMATVYLARDLRHQREVALKVLKPELGAVLGTDRFLSEIRVTANLQHPNLLPLFDSGEAGGLLFYVMPFVRGETLRAKIDRERQLSVDEAVRIAVAVASALQCAHESGVIHRDLKPENILIQSGQPVIADFGIALAVSKAGGARVTQTGLSLGTPQYMSPEQATGDRVIDARSDIYSLGAVTYEMLSGEPPHSGSSAQAIIAKLMTSEPQPLNTLRSTIPVNVACAVEKALAKLPADRFASAQEYANALQNPSFTIASKYTRTSTEQSAATRKWQRIAIGAAAAAFLAFAAALWGTLKPEPPKPVVRYVLGMDSTEIIGGGLRRIAMSPDGSLLAYSLAPDFNLYVRRRDQLRGTIVPGATEAYSPFFSQDGGKVGYLSPPGLLKVVSMSGGPPVVISDSVTGAGGAFGPDGRIYATRLNSWEIVRMVDAPGSRLDAVTTVDTARGERRHFWPEVLPDGKSMLFVIVYGTSGTALAAKASMIAVADLGTGKHHTLVAGVRATYSPSGHLLYATSDGSLMVSEFDPRKGELRGSPASVAPGLRVGAGLAAASDFHVSQGGTLAYLTGQTGSERELIWIERDGKIEPVDPAWRGTFNTPSLSPDGKKVAVSIAAGTRTDIWVKQLDRGPSLKLTFEGTENIYPGWTPDGRNITYQSNASTPVGIWTKRADGSAQAFLQIQAKADLAASLWSRDGKWLVYRSSVNVAGAGDILAIRPGVDSAPNVLMATPFAELDPALSPDGKWLAYVSNETGRHEVYVVPFPNVATAKWPISTSGGSQPAWAHSGRELFFRSTGNLVSVPVQTSPTFSAGAATALFPTRGFVSNANRRQYDVAPGDNRFIFVRSVGGQAVNDLVLVDNWFEEL